MENFCQNCQDGKKLTQFLCNFCNPLEGENTRQKPITIRPDNQACIINFPKSKSYTTALPEKAISLEVAAKADSRYFHAF